MSRGCPPSSSSSRTMSEAEQVKTPEDEEATASASAISLARCSASSAAVGLHPGHHPQWCELLAGVSGAAASASRPDQLIAEIAAVAAPSSEHVLQHARRCGRRFMRVFSDNLHNCYVDLLDSKHMMEYRARALKRRLCRGSKKQVDNELYRSNSFKFERFERQDDANDKQVALCDDYSLPVDFVNKGRPVSACEPGRPIELLDTYCDPRDSKAYLVPGEEVTAKVYTSPDREYTHPYADGTRAGARFCKAAKAAKLAARNAAAAAAAAISAAASVSDPERDGDGAGVAGAADRPSAPPAEDDGAYEDVIVQELQEKYILELQQQLLLEQCKQQQLQVDEQPVEEPVAAPRCPYYYADLLLPRAPPREHRKKTGDSRRCRKSASVDGACQDHAADVSVEASEVLVRAPRPARGWSEDGSGMGRTPWTPTAPSAPAAPTTLQDADEDQDDDEDMSRRRHLYETAFDSRVAAPADRREEDVSHHAILAVSPSAAALSALASQDGTPAEGRREGVDGALAASSHTLSTALCGSACGSLCSAMGGLRLGASRSSGSASGSASGSDRGGDWPYATPPPGSAPASAPLPTKFHGPGVVAGSVQSALMSIRSAPHLLAQQQGSVREIKGRPTSLLVQAKEVVPAEDVLARPSRTKAIQEFKGRPSRAERPLSLAAPRRPKFSSTESMATSSSGGSLESVRSSTSEGERSSSSDGRPGSSSLSSHSEDSAGPLHGPLATRLYGHNSTKLHILSPISDKSSLEPCSETSDNNRNNNSERASPEPDSGTTPTATTTTTTTPGLGTPTGAAPNNILAANNGVGSDNSKNRRRTPNRNLISLSLHGMHGVLGNKIGDNEVPGSDSGISVDGNLRWANNQQDLEHLPFDMPKLRRRRANMVLDTTTSGSATSVEAVSVGNAVHDDLPFDMPKLRRKLRAASSESSSTSQSSEPQDAAQDAAADPLLGLPFDMPKLRKKLSRSSESSSASQSEPSVSTGLAATGAGGRPALSLNLANGPGMFGGCNSLGTPTGTGPADNFGSGLASAFAPTRALRGLSLGSLGRPGLSLSFGANSTNAPSAHIDTSVPLERQGWYLGAISRLEAERLLRQAGEGSYLVRNSESTRQDFSLSLKSARGFMHMRIQKDENGRFILGQFSRPFESVPEMIRHFSVNRLPIRGAEHMCLLHPVIQPLL